MFFSQATGAGTATNGLDHNNICSIFTIPANQTSATLTITPIQDNLVEGTEALTLTIAPRPEYTAATGHGTATINIADN